MFRNSYLFLFFLGKLICMLDKREDVRAFYVEHSQKKKEFQLT